jgi:hypothetical protein
VNRANGAARAVASARARRISSAATSCATRNWPLPSTWSGDGVASSRPAYVRSSEPRKQIEQDRDDLRTRTAIEEAEAEWRA